MGDARRSDHGIMKMLVENHSRKILGLTSVGYESATMVHQILPIMSNASGGKLDDLLNCIFIHPALSEILRNCGRKARDALIAAR